jgi:hypothetical protein
MGGLLFCLKRDSWDQEVRTRLKTVLPFCRQFYGLRGLRNGVLLRSNTCRQFLLGRLIDIVSQITVLAVKLASISRRGKAGGRQGIDNKCIHIECYTSDYRQWLIYSRIYLAPIPKSKLKYFFQSRDDSIGSKSICLCREVTHAVDGFAMARPVICKLRPSKIYC